MKMQIKTKMRKASPNYLDKRQVITNVYRSESKNYGILWKTVWARPKKIKNKLPAIHLLLLGFI